jgi:hypothetical protein
VSLVSHAVVPSFGDVGILLRVLALLFVFGVFCSAIVVTEEDRKYVSTGSRIRMVCGAIAGGACALMLSAPVPGIALGVLLGVILGYVGKHWVYYI